MKRLVKAYDGFSFYDDYTYRWTGWDNGDYSKWELLSDGEVAIRHEEPHESASLPDNKKNPSDSDLEFIALAKEVDIEIKFYKQLEETLSE